MIHFRTLYITPITLFYRTSEPIELNGIMGNTLRRCLETTFKRIDDALLKRNPDAFPFFRSKISDEIIERFPDLKDFSTPPRGYSIAFNIDPDDPFLLRININFFGRYAKVIPLLLPRLPTLMDSWFRGSLKFVTVSDANENSIPLSNEHSNAALTINYSLFERAKLSEKKILLHFISPTMLNNRHNNFGDMHFNELIQAIYRRADVINRLYCKGEMAPPLNLTSPHELIDVEKINLEWIHSPSGSKENPITGYIGHVQYKGPILAQYLPLLILGQWLQVGKKTNYGAGQYVIDNEYYTFI